MAIILSPPWMPLPGLYRTAWDVFWRSSLRCMLAMWLRPLASAGEPPPVRSDWHTGLRGSDDNDSYSSPSRHAAICRHRSLAGLRRPLSGEFSVPSALAAGNQALALTVDGVSTTPNGCITVASNLVPRLLNRPKWGGRPRPRRTPGPLLHTLAVAERGRHGPGTARSLSCSGAAPHRFQPRDAIFGRGMRRKQAHQALTRERLDDEQVRGRRDSRPASESAWTSLSSLPSAEISSSGIVRHVRRSFIGGVFARARNGHLDQHGRDGRQDQHG